MRKRRTILFFFSGHTYRSVLLTAGTLGIALCVSAQIRRDSTQTLQKVTVTAEKKQNPFALPVPVQILNRDALLQIHAESIADAAKYFSGVLIKDFGGVGGLKTISVRSLGGLNTGLLYDGIVVADAQTGQIDLSKFSATFVQSLELYQSGPPQLLLPARAYASASVLAITSNTYQAVNFTREKWIAGVNSGSFGLWQPYAGVYLPTGKHAAVSVNAEATWAGGRYPYTVDNGSFSQKANRSNSDLHSFQSELNFIKQFSDSSCWQTKAWLYQSDRGLPGSIVFFNDIAVQRLTDRDFFIQSQYQKSLGPSRTLLLSAKYSNYYTRYTDPNFLNNNGGLDDRYTQNEGYVSAAVRQRIGSFFTLAFASDLARTHLSSNILSFPAPTRTNLWNNFALQFSKTHWQINASLLNTNIHDQTKTGTAAPDKNKFTPAIALSYKTVSSSPWLFRAFYKEIFRMPTFNDLYYTYNTNINPKLRPEYTRQYNAGATYSKIYRGTLQQFSFSVDGYYNSIQDKIIAVPSQNLFVWSLVNLGRVQIKGADLNADLNGIFSEATKWSLRIAYTWQQALDVTSASSAQYKNEIPYTPEHSGSARAALYYRSWSGGVSMLFSGKRYTLGENTPGNALPGWATEDVMITKQFRLHEIQATIRAELNNISNDRYDVVRYYPMPGRSFKLGLNFKNL